MPDQYIREYYFDGGINNTLADELIADNEMADARNLHPKKTGQGNLVKRCGVKAVSDGATYPAGTTLWTDYAPVYCGKNGNYYCEAFGPDFSNWTFNIYKESDGSVLYTDTTTIAFQPTWCTFDRYDLYADSGHKVKTSNGTNFSAISNMPTSANVIEPYNNYLFCLVNGTTNGKFTLNWSAIHDCETWPATQQLLFQLTDSYDLQSGLRAWGDVLALSTLNQIYFLQGFGPTDFTIVAKLLGSGAANQDLFVSCPLGLYWWDLAKGLTGITQLGQQPDFIMQRKLSKIFSDYKAANFLGHLIWRSDLECISCYLITSTGLATELRVDYFPKTDSFFIHNGTTAIVNGVSFDRGSVTTGFTGSTILFTYRNPAVGGMLYLRTEDETLSQDLGVSYTAYLKTKRRSDPLKSAWKNVKSVFITTKFPSGGAMTYQIMADNQTTANQTFTLTQEAAVVTDNYLSINQKHRKIQHYLTDSLNQRTEYYGIVETGTVDKIV